MLEVKLFQSFVFTDAISKSVQSHAALQLLSAVLVRTVQRARFR